MAEIKTRPATPEFRDGYDRIFAGKKYDYVTYPVDGADRSPEMQVAMDRSMQVIDDAHA